MLDTNNFVKMLSENGYTHLCVVPCSFSKNLFNASINNKKLIEYIPCASEAVACSVASGLKMSNKKPIVIVQSSGLTNLGSCITSLLVPYKVYFPIIVSWRTYNEGDSEIQHKHLAKKLPDLVKAYGYDYEIIDKNNEDVAINQVNKCNESQTLCLLEKETFSPIDLNADYKLDLSKYPRRSEYLIKLNEEFSETDTIFIGTTGNTAREMYSFMPDTKNFYMAGNMGGALSVGLGAFLAGKKVFVCGGDAEFVMHLGGITTAGRYKNTSNNGFLAYIVFDNESNKSTGGQGSYQNHVIYSQIAKNSNFNIRNTISEVNDFELSLKKDLTNFCFFHVKCSYDDTVPRPPLDVVAKNNL
tara:strand:+ start:21286 stop:22356 length:1071 start_codon:yes stop_codon:yes gene_type:complete